MFFVPFGFKFVFFLARLSPEVKINEKMKKSNNLLFQSCKLEKNCLFRTRNGVSEQFALGALARWRNLKRYFIDN